MDFGKHSHIFLERKIGSGGIVRSYFENIAESANCHVCENLLILLCFKYKIWQSHQTQFLATLLDKFLPAALYDMILLYKGGLNSL